MYDLGIIGGMGPSATCYFFNMIINLSNVANDQEHLKIVVLNNTKIPDRTKYILTKKDSPWDEIKKSIIDLEGIGCKNIVVTCNTAHYFDSQIKDMIGDVFLSLIDLTEQYLISEELFNKRIIVLGTEGTKAGKIYKSDKIKFNYPNDRIQSKIMDIIYNIKSGSHNMQILGEKLNAILLNEYNEEKDTVYILGCTELSILSEHIKLAIVDPLEITAKEILRRNGIKIKK